MLQALPSSACSQLTTNTPLRSLQAHRVLEHIDIGVECYAVQAVPCIIFVKGVARACDQAMVRSRAAAATRKVKMPVFLHQMHV